MPRTFYTSPLSISCVSCEKIINKKFTEIEGVNGVQVSININRQAVITVDDVELSDKDLCEQFKNTLADYGCEQVTSSRLTYKKKNLTNYWYQGGFSSLLGLTLLCLSIFNVVLPLSLMYIMGGFCTLLTLYLGKETYIHAIQELYHRNLGMNTLLGLSTLVALTVSVLSFFIPGLPMQFDAPLLILGLNKIGKGIEKSLINEVVSGANYSDRTPSHIKLADEKEISVKELKCGDIIRVYPGQTIPVDGQITTGPLCVKDPIVSDHNDIEIKQNETVLAGMIVPDTVNYLEIKATATFANSRLARLDGIINKIEKREESSLELQANKMLGYFVPIILGLASVAGFCMGYCIDAMTGVQFAISMLVSACPCILGLIIPMTVKIGIDKAAEKGAYFKSSESLQKASEVKKISFDLNGTLTTKPRVDSFKENKVNNMEISKNQIFLWCHQLEKKSNHSYAQAICNYIERNYRITNMAAAEFKNVDDTHHSGIRGFINDQWLTIGNQTMMLRHGINIPQIEINERIIFVAYKEQVLGYFTLTDSFKQDAQLVIAELKKMHKDIYLCTGENSVVAHACAKSLGINDKNVAANCGPAGEDKQMSKQSYVQSLKTNSEEVIMVVGDGANDAVAMQQGGLGVAVFSEYRADETVGGSRIVISESSLMPIIASLIIAEQTVNHVKRSLRFNIIYNICAVVLPFVLFVTQGVTLHPGVCALFMVIQAALLLRSTQSFKSSEVPLNLSIPGSSPDKLLPLHEVDERQVVQAQPALTSTVSTTSKIAGLASSMHTQSASVPQSQSSTRYNPT